MEASERPQLQLDHSDDGTISWPLGEKLVIERLTIEDARVAKLVRERAEGGHAPAQTVRDAIEIGARVLEREGTAAEVDYVRAEFERHAGELRERLTKSLESGDEQLAERIAANFDGSRDGSVQKQIDKLVGTALEEQRMKIVRLFSAEDGANPLTDFKGEVVRGFRALAERQQKEGEANRQRIEALQRELVELREGTEADARVAEEAERGTAKGRTFEELVHATIEEVAQGQGDAAHHTGDAANESGSKKGDVVVEIGGALGSSLATIVFEAKNKRLSKNDAWTELNACMGERDATFAVLVVAGEDKVPAGLEELTEYQGNKIIAVLDREEPDPLALRLVYRYVRARVLADGATDLEVDAAGVRDAAEEAGARLKRANRVRKALTSVTNSAKVAGDEFDEIVADVERCLARIEGLVAAAAASEDA
jgi:flagellar hook-basal body complex protein FliE